MTNSQWPMTETVALLAGRGRPTGQCLCGSWAPLSRGRPVMTLVIGHWAFIGDWSLVIGHCPLVIGRQGGSIQFVNGRAPGAARAILLLPSGRGLPVYESRLPSARLAQW